LTIFYSKETRIVENASPCTLDDLLGPLDLRMGNKLDIRKRFVRLGSRNSMLRLKNKVNDNLTPKHSITLFLSSTSKGI
jgi:hypothetical protein